MREVDMGDHQKYAWKPEEAQLVCAVLAALQRQGMRRQGYRRILTLGQSIRVNYNAGQLAFIIPLVLVGIYREVLTFTHSPQHLLQNLLRWVNT
jgi:hypothetical protein